MKIIMNNYKISLTRVYNIEIIAENEEKAKELAEYYIGDPKDASSLKDRERENFKIESIEMVINEAAEAEEIEN